ncbi:hypothetical protein BTA51_02255 [Hahella sp. CCB-MM4]|nr:hypothetical protein BTA51_02255 [Hahella sp. CCB-MM4]
MQRTKASEKSNKALIQILFLFIGFIFSLIGSSHLLDGDFNRVGYVNLGMGIVFIGWSFSPSYFLKDLKENAETSKLTSNISIIGWLIIFVGFLMEYLRT